MSVELSADGETRRRVNDNVRFIVGSGIPTDGSTGANVCGPASLYFDITNKIVYINTNTKISPTWISITAAIAAGSVTTAMLADLAVTTAKLANLGVTTGKIALLAITTALLNDLAVTQGKLALLSVGTGQLIDLNVTTGKLALLSVGTSQLALNSVDGAITTAATFKQVTGTISSADITSTSAGKFGHADGYIILAGQGASSIIELISLILTYDFSVAAYTVGGNITVNRSAGAGALTGLISAANSVGAAADRIVQFKPLSAAGINLTLNEGINLVSSAAFTQPGTAAGVIRYVCNYRVHATGL